MAVINALDGPETSSIYAVRCFQWMARFYCQWIIVKFDVVAGVAIHKKGQSTKQSASASCMCTVKWKGETESE